MADSAIAARRMTADEAIRLEAMMRAEELDYMQDFLAFAESGELARQRSASRHDTFFALHIDDNLAGFFCLRGLDEGYERPVFGVYVSSRFAGRGLGRYSLQDALRICAKNEIPRVMLKVAYTNNTARNLYQKAGFTTCGRCADTGHEVMEKVLEIR